MESGSWTEFAGYVHSDPSTWHNAGWVHHDGHQRTSTSKESDADDANGWIDYVNQKQERRYWWDDSTEWRDGVEQWKKYGWVDYTEQDQEMKQEDKSEQEQGWKHSDFVVDVVEEGKAHGWVDFTAVEKKDQWIPDGLADWKKSGWVDFSEAEQKEDKNDELSHEEQERHLDEQMRELEEQEEMEFMEREAQEAIKLRIELGIESSALHTPSDDVVNMDAVASAEDEDSDNINFNAASDCPPTSSRVVEEEELNWWNRNDDLTDEEEAFISAVRTAIRRGDRQSAGWKFEIEVDDDMKVEDVDEEDGADEQNEDFLSHHGYPNLERRFPGYVESDPSTWWRAGWGFYDDDEEQIKNDEEEQKHQDDATTADEADDMGTESSLPDLAARFPGYIESDPSTWWRAGWRFYDNEAHVQSNLENNSLNWWNEQNDGNTENTETTQETTTSATSYPAQSNFEDRFPGYLESDPSTWHLAGWKHHDDACTSTEQQAGEQTCSTYFFDLEAQMYPGSYVEEDSNSNSAWGHFNSYPDLAARFAGYVENDSSTWHSAGWTWHPANKNWWGFDDEEVAPFSEHKSGWADYEFQASSDTSSVNTYPWKHYEQEIEAAFASSRAEADAARRADAAAQTEETPRLSQEDIDASFAASRADASFAQTCEKDENAHDETEAAADTSFDDEARGLGFAFAEDIEDQFEVLDEPAELQDLIDELDLCEVQNE
eukprot:CAMPEP_0178998154 /NCGR_PEP_ID=MMETSP0795-20121207/9367_1 /TAXON_ID=88552 /ORGANISM="Amoebophrya sp., Strain Ameob2" /LENGTH=715 /DNA_ID=CAMNT_0020690825 /DNA_START=144 /DNA_END=2291 /DNA_ORIENTATION=+